MIIRQNKEVIGVFKNNTPISRIYKGNHLIFGTAETNDVLEFEFSGSSVTFKLNGNTYTATTSPYKATLADLGIGEWTNASYMFSEKSNITSITKIPDTSKVTTMYASFYECSGLTSLDLSSLNTSNVTTMRLLFYKCNKITNLNISNFDTKNVTNMSNMFADCRGLTSITFGENFDTSNVTTMEEMFDGCDYLTELDLSNFDTSKVTNMANMFYSCNRLKELNLSNFDTSEVTRIGSMFQRCTDLISLDISNFDTSKVTNIASMFSGCDNLKQLKWNNLGNGSGYIVLDIAGPSNLGVGYEDDLKNTFVHNSFDRASAGISTLTIKLHENTKTRFSDTDIATMSAKGITIA